jgi:hypothetical protein
MDVPTGQARVVGPLGLAPMAWLNEATILGTLSTTGANGSTKSSVVVIDPSTGQLRTILDQSTIIVGVA